VAFTIHSDSDVNGKILQKLPQPSERSTTQDPFLADMICPSTTLPMASTNLCPQFYGFVCWMTQSGHSGTNYLFESTGNRDSPTTHNAKRGSHVTCIEHPCNTALCMCASSHQKDSR
jgi:hypothetical protein